ncbi:hypothetical protein BT69DRAFT_1355078 [Atractiella rhizophila]|nr:hypothetical protein BT69DRAFT_1355078 [Atractiella rhizophila]
MDRSAIVLLSLLSLVNAQSALINIVGGNGVTNVGLGVQSQTPSEAQGIAVSDNSCGASNTNQALATSTAGGIATPDDSGNLNMEVFIINSDGDGPYTCALDTSGTGDSFDTPLTIKTNVNNKVGEACSLVAAMPSGITCPTTGCIVQCKNSAGFGGCVPVLPSNNGAASTGTTGSTTNTGSAGNDGSNDDTGNTESAGDTGSAGNSGNAGGASDSGNGANGNNAVKRAAASPSNTVKKANAGAATKKPKTSTKPKSTAVVKPKTSAKPSVVPFPHLISLVLTKRSVDSKSTVKPKTSAKPKSTVKPKTTTKPKSTPAAKTQSSKSPKTTAGQAKGQVRRRTWRALKGMGRKH